MNILYFLITGGLLISHGYVMLGIIGLISGVMDTIKWVRST